MSWMDLVGTALESTAQYERAKADKRLAASQEMQAASLAAVATMSNAQASTAKESVPQQKSGGIDWMKTGLVVGGVLAVLAVGALVLRK